MKRVLFAVIFSFGFGGVGYVVLGLYPIGADVPHTTLTYGLLEFVRERSISRASQDIEVPNLESPDWLLRGGADYNDMCASCHLKPGKVESDLSVGLYPKPPNLSVIHTGHTYDAPSVEGQARRQFWIIKHGVKASGMPAWGPTHSDERIWAMVAFLQRLPELDSEQYQILTARGEGQHEHH
ncbi:hypothetical protein NBRC116494_15830 [Aurantivibrio plasticivorans]